MIYSTVLAIFGSSVCAKTLNGSLVGLEIILYWPLSKNKLFSYLSAPIVAICSSANSEFINELQIEVFPLPTNPSIPITIFSIIFKEGEFQEIIIEIEMNIIMIF